MTKMFEDSFDPYRELQILRQEVTEQRDTINKLINFVNEQQQHIHDLSAEFVKVTDQNVYVFKELGRLLELETKRSAT